MNKPTNTIMLGIGDYGASGTQDSMLKTMALGSCVAVIMLDPQTKTVGMVHIALPDSNLNKSKREQRPGYFADTGIPSLLKKMRDVGAGQDIRKYYVKITGGANVLKTTSASVFDIGKRNILAVKKILWQNGTGVVAEDVGGNISRTVSVYVGTGRVEIHCPGKGDWTL
jgi:chemotaxis protein CheD